LFIKESQETLHKFNILYTLYVTEYFKLPLFTNFNVHDKKYKNSLQVLQSVKAIHASHRNFPELAY